MRLALQVFALPFRFPRITGLAILALLSYSVGASLADAYGTGHGVKAHPKTTQLARNDIPDRYLALYRKAPKCRGLEWNELAAFGKAESNHGRVPGSKRGGSSSAGALGPMQFMPATWRTWGRGGNVYKPEHAIPAAARLLCALGAGRNLTLAAAGYNAGPGAVKRYGGVPPYPETRAYVARVRLFADAYRKGSF